MLAADPGNLEIYRLLAEIHRDVGNPAEAGRWGFLTGEATDAEIEAFELAHPQPWIRLQLLGWPGGPDGIEDDSARARLVHLQELVGQVTIPLQRRPGRSAAVASRSQPVASRPVGSPTRTTADQDSVDAAGHRGFVLPSQIPAQRPAPQSAGTKSAGTKSAGTKSAGTKGRGTKDKGTKNRETKARGTTNAGTNPEVHPEPNPGQARTADHGPSTDQATSDDLAAALELLPSAHPEFRPAPRPAGSPETAGPRSAVGRLLNGRGPDQAESGPRKPAQPGSERWRERSFAAAARNYLILLILILRGSAGSVVAVAGIRALFGVKNWLAPVTAIFQALIKLFTG
jgi:hypothetical protein